MAIRTYNYLMGFAVDGKPLPDPSEFTGVDSALDASGARDATGLLHREMVATKHPTKLKWNALDWETISEILQMLTGDSFMFTYPDPCTGQLQTIKCYCGDRAWDVKLITNPSRTYIGSLSFSAIEY